MRLTGASAGFWELLSGDVMEAKGLSRARVLQGSGGSLVPLSRAATAATASEMPLCGT